MSLTRSDAIAAVMGDHRDFAVIAGVGSAVFDLVALTGDAGTMFPLDGAMGAAVSTGLGLALARPDLDVLVVTGDGEVLMNVGALATVAVQDPPNLSIVVVDNGQYGLTGGQATHTAHGTDIAGMAAAAGIVDVTTCVAEADLAAGAATVRKHAHASLVVLKVDATASEVIPVERNGTLLRDRFQAAVNARSQD
jgi:thiamine pyrophosphate-dependent acetolactate synthase large subunit-like protein